jgi:hypothetical protein
MSGIKRTLWLRGVPNKRFQRTSVLARLTWRRELAPLKRNTFGGATDISSTDRFLGSPRVLECAASIGLGGSMQEVWATYGSLGGRVIVGLLAVAVAALLVAAVVVLTRGGFRPARPGAVGAFILLLASALLLTGLPAFVSSDHQGMWIVGTSAFYLRSTELPIVAAWVIGLLGAVVLLAAARRGSADDSVRQLAVACVCAGVALMVVGVAAPFWPLGLC